MQYVIFARDRRRRKNRVKGLVFFMALFSILIGIWLALNPESPPTQAVEIAPKETNSPPSQVVESANSSHHSEPNYIEPPTNTVDEEATSYDDDLTDNDDEIDEEIDESKVQNAGDKTQQEEQLPDEVNAVLARFLDVTEQAIRIQNQFSYTVAQGDKLKDVLEQSGIDDDTSSKLEKKFPALAKLKPSQQFYWLLDKNGDLEYMNWIVSEKEEQIFERQANDTFTQQIIQKKGVWKQEVVQGTIDNDLNSSLRKVGLSKRQISQLTSAIQWQIATNKLKKGDKFAILVKREYIDNKVTELGNVDAIRILSAKKSYYAIQADNGRYYNRNGETLGKGFSRFPLQGRAKVTSPFNPRRFHPVTRRVAPHRGVDFGMPVGTPIIAPADGVVEHVAYQSGGAGRYIKLRHGGQYATVYMHLSKSLVKVGQNVKKGDRIALSGNTGRSTGPHLHYEFHINGQPVNPMTVKLPGTGSGMPEKDRKVFLQKAKAVEAKLKL